MQREIEEEMGLGFEGFLDVDKSFATVSLEDLEAGARLLFTG